MLADQHTDLCATQYHRLRTGFRQRIHDPQVFGLGVGFDLAEAQLLIDRLMYDRPISFIRHQHIQSELVAQPAFVEVLFHGEAGAEQADALHTISDQNHSGGVRQMQ